MEHETPSSKAAGGAEALAKADRAFLRAMIPHHEAAIAMAREVLAKGRDARVRDLAQGIAGAQADEIRQMRSLLGEAGRDEGKGRAGGMAATMAALAPPAPISLMAAQALPALAAGSAVPDWVHLLPAGAIRTHDGRGPYRVEDANAVIAASMADERGLPIDENHSTDLAAPQGREAPARGWIAELASRADGLWGRVDWTATGAALLADRAYRGLSPVILHDKAGRVLRILGASLVNRPNLRGLAALHAEDHDMEDLQRIAVALGLAASATADEAVARAEELAAGGGGSTALNSALTDIGAALGVEADQGQIVAAATLARAGADDVVALQGQVTALQGELDGLRANQTRAASEAYVDGELARGRSGLNAQNRDRLVALHMEKPDDVRALIEGMPVLGGAAPKRAVELPAAGGAVSLNAQQLGAAKVLGISPEDYAKTLQAEKAIA